jgi:hypothetical protein
MQDSRRVVWETHGNTVVVYWSLKLRQAGISSTFNEVKVLYADVAVIVQVCEAWKAHLVCVRKAHRDLNSARRCQRVVLDVHISSRSATSHPIFHDSLTTIRPQATFSGRSLAITRLERWRGSSKRPSRK